MTKAWLESFIQKKSAQPVSLLKCVGEAAPFRSSTKQKESIPPPSQLLQ
jgi:hypothetical protein